jgi:hypothetical protein
MKTTCLIILSMLLTAKVYSQQYIPFPTNNAYWLNNYIVDDAGVFSVRGMLFLNGHDTTIHSKLYHTLFMRTYTRNGTIPYNGQNLVADSIDGILGYIREDSQKVYFLSSAWYNADTTDSLIYDYTLHVGDSARGKHTGTVISSIDNITLNNISYPRFNCADGSYYIEGIGDNGGLIPLFGYNPSGSVENNFMCFNNTSTGTTFDPGNYACIYIFPYGTLTAVNNVTEIETKVYPNPFYEQISIDATNNGTASIYNDLGTTVLKQAIKPGTNTVSEACKLAPGIYYLVIRNSDGSILKNEKLVKL